MELNMHTTHQGRLNSWKIFNFARIAQIYLISFLLIMMGLSNAALAGGAPGPGSLDTTFDTDGMVRTDFGPVVTGNTTITRSFAKAVAIQADGKIVAAGDNGWQFALARYNPDGSLDASFGTGGKVSTAVPTYSAGWITTMAIQPDGKIVVAGESNMARYHSDGTLDTSFGVKGIVSTLAYNSCIAGLALQPDGKILLSGGCYTNSGFVLARYDSRGNLDQKGFGTSGVVSFTANYQFDAQQESYDVVVQPDGKILIGSAGIPQAALYRLNSDGTLDTTFGNGGNTLFDFPIFAVMLQPDGKIVIAGGTPTTSNNYYSGDFVVARYNSDGSLDPAFGSSGGVITTSVGDYHDYATALALQADGKIVVGGETLVYSRKNGYLNPYFGVVRYDTIGNIDTSFGNRGIATTGSAPILSSTDYVADHLNALALQADGKIVAAGLFNSTSGNRFGLVRYLP